MNPTASAGIFDTRDLPCIIFKGVNRHEHHPLSGRTVPYASMKRDLLMMKTHNTNALRTCHQPNDPRLYDLADELGFWVVDEADLECHGFEMIEDAALSPEEWALPFLETQNFTRHKAAKWTNDNPEWHDAYLDRAKQLADRKRGDGTKAMMDWAWRHDGRW